FYTMTAPGTPGQTYLDTLRIYTPMVQIVGAKFTATGCSLGSTLGGTTAGSFVTGTNGPCSVTVTLSNAGQLPSTDYVCNATDSTTLAGNPVWQTGAASRSTATFTFNSSMLSGDLVRFN